MKELYIMKEHLKKKLKHYRKERNRLGGISSHLATINEKRDFQKFFGKVEVLEELIKDFEKWIQ